MRRRRLPELHRVIVRYPISREIEPFHPFMPARATNGVSCMDVGPEAESNPQEIVPKISRVRIPDVELASILNACSQNLPNSRVRDSCRSEKSVGCLVMKITREPLKLGGQPSDQCVVQLRRQTRPAGQASRDGLMRRDQCIKVGGA